MVSKTAQTEIIRERKYRKMGRKRKNTLANHGSTPSQEDLFGSKSPDEKPKSQAKAS